jgi:hypothetical protein
MSMGRTVVVLHLIVGWSLILSPVLTGMLMVAWGGFVSERTPGHRWWSVVLCVAITSWILAAALWNLYPSAVARWWFD